jgi:hypothetical protein
MVAVISSATPNVKKTRILLLNIFFRCSVIIAIEYDINAKITMVVPKRSNGFINRFINF